MSSISELVEMLDKMSIPVAKLLNLNPAFTATVKSMVAMLMRNSSQDKDEQDGLIDEATIAIDMLIAEGVFATNVSGDLIAGEKFLEFKECLSRYFDMDQTILRILGISQQDFDNLKREYTVITTDTHEFAGILTEWSNLDPEVKLGIVRGVFLQRGIMATVVGEAINGFDVIENYGIQMKEWLKPWAVKKSNGPK
jgi:hypothetical protein